MQKIIEKITNDSRKQQIVVNNRELISYKNPVLF
jgi:hypothetical protein